jgi:hypothetical protein
MSISAREMPLIFSKNVLKFETIAPSVFFYFAENTNKRYGQWND